VEAILRDMKVELVSEALLVKYVPTGQDLDRCFDLGVRVARQLEEICGEG